MRTKITRTKLLSASFIAACICTFAAQAAYAGCMGGAPNGVLEGGEECDDGNTLNNDVCGSDCTFNFCGDGRVQTKGGCTTNGLTSGLTATQCLVDTDCSSGQTCIKKNGLEECDDGNTSNNDACLNTCKLNKCGDGHTCSGTGCGSVPGTILEECDDAGNGGDADDCTNACKINVCDDGKKHTILFCASDNAVAGRCGNNPVEDCDDGNQVCGDGCDPNCHVSGCRNGFKCAASGEECDDGNGTDTDACTNACKVNVCGDGIQCTDAASCGVAAGTVLEECDNGTPKCMSFGASNGKECGTVLGQKRCKADGGVCGAGNKDWKADACRVACKKASCGDGVLDSTESCDDGTTGSPLDDADSCPNGPQTKAKDISALYSQAPGTTFAACHVEQACGDAVPLLVPTSAKCTDLITGAPAGVCPAAPEGCDSGGGAITFNVPGAVSNAACVLGGVGPICVIPATKTCAGNPAAQCSIDGDCAAGTGPCGRSDTTPNACRKSCTPAGCGDDVIDKNETCDNGNSGCFIGMARVDGLSCKDKAATDACVAAGGNVCRHLPDGAKGGTDDCAANDQNCNISRADLPNACRNNCALPSCGDGVVNAGEDCDNGTAHNGVDCVGSVCCTSKCKNNACHDGEKLGTEECDDTNTSNNDACVDTCKNAKCGDGFLHTGVELCDDGNTVNFDGCSADCCPEPSVSLTATADKFAAMDCNRNAISPELTPIAETLRKQLQKSVDRAKVRQDKALLQINGPQPGRACGQLKSAKRFIAGFASKVDQSAAGGLITPALQVALDGKAVNLGGWYDKVRHELGCTR